MTKIKRSLDMAFSLLFLLVFSPLVIILSLLIMLESPGPILFKQKRVGKNEKLFHIYKFRSMYVNTIDPFKYDLIKHTHPLITRVGRFMRRTKLDEIPQLWNVLRGDMSFVGPRPCLIEHTNSLSLLERRRFRYLPGMTGWAEVNGLDMDSWGDRLLLDLWYVDHQSLWLDLIIIIRTLFIILFGSKRNEKVLEQARLYLSSKGTVE